MLQELSNAMARSVARPSIPWPDWRGRTVAIVACGPSANKENVEKLKGLMPVLAIKEAAVLLCPWAEVVYGCDAPWWRFRRGLPEFKGLKLRWDGNGCSDYPDVHPVTIKDKQLDRMLTDEVGVIGSGRNSGFQGVNLAAQFGPPRRMLMVGFDMHGRSSAHFYGRNNWPMANNPAYDNFPKWIAAFNQAKADLDALGIEVINACPTSDLKCFPLNTVDGALKQWRLVA